MIKMAVIYLKQEVKAENSVKISGSDAKSFLKSIAKLLKSL